MPQALLEGQQKEPQSVGYPDGQPLLLVVSAQPEAVQEAPLSQQWLPQSTGYPAGQEASPPLLVRHPPSAQTAPLGQQ